MPWTEGPGQRGGFRQLLGPAPVRAVVSSMEFNFQRHRLVSRVFLDQEHSEEEDRFVIVGMSSGARLLVVVHCYRESDSVIRIISARKAAKKEAQFYEEGI